MNLVLFFFKRYHFTSTSPGLIFSFSKYSDYIASLKGLHVLLQESSIWIMLFTIWAFICLDEYLCTYTVHFDCLEKLSSIVIEDGKKINEQSFVKIFMI